jgi:uncharacterized membrane protein
MVRLGYAAAIGIIGAGIVHIVTLLLIPAVSDLDTWARLANFGDLNTFHRIERVSETAASFRALDPMLEVTACRFDLADGAVHVRSDGTASFWSLSVYNRRGESIFSINDRTAIESLLDTVIATPRQLIDLRKSLAPEVDASIVAEADIEEGFVVLRAFVEDESVRPLVDGFLESASCDLL